VGWAQRSRHRLKPGTICYLCGRPISEGEAWDRDHVPPQRFYGTEVRARFNPNLRWHPAHKSCNSAFKKDEEYYVACFAGHARSPTGRAVFDDFRRGTAKGHDAGLLRTIVAQFGKVTMADGSRVFNFDPDRVGRVEWKLVRGIYFGETGRFLPEDARKRIFMVMPQNDGDPAQKYPWWTIVRDTAPMGEHGAVFDYKWIGTTLDGIRGHALGILLWDRLLVLTLFHDPTCLCDQCRDSGNNPMV
jgi:hypothetical protein